MLRLLDGAYWYSGTNKTLLIVALIFTVNGEGTLAGRSCFDLRGSGYLTV